MSWLVGAIVTALATWLADRIEKFFGIQARRAEVKEEAKESVLPLKKAETKEEVDEAAKRALDGI